MAWTFELAWESGNGQGGQNANDQLAYILTGSADDADDGDASNPALVQAYAEEHVAETYLGRAWTDVQRSRIGDYTWAIAANYDATTFTPTGERTFTFDTSGGTQHITRALHHRQTYKPGGTTSTPSDGWLNVDEDGKVSGVDLPTGAFEFTIDVFLHPGDMTEDYVALLSLLTYTTNGTTFTVDIQGVTFSFPAGEVLFKGATGSLRGYGDWALGLKFARQKNVESRDFGSGSDAIDGVAYKGWDYLGFATEKMFAEVDSNKFIAPKLKYVFVDQVYGDENWTGLIPVSTT